MAKRKSTFLLQIKCLAFVASFGFVKRLVRLLRQLSLNKENFYPEYAAENHTD